MIERSHLSGRSTLDVCPKQILWSFQTWQDFAQIAMDVFNQGMRFKRAVECSSMQN